MSVLVWIARWMSIFSVKGLSILCAYVFLHDWTVDWWRKAVFQRTGRRFRAALSLPAGSSAPTLQPACLPNVLQLGFSTPLQSCPQTRPIGKKERETSNHQAAHTAQTGLSACWPKATKPASPFLSRPCTDSQPPCTLLLLQTWLCVSPPGEVIWEDLDSSPVRERRIEELTQLFPQGWDSGK